MSLVTLHAVEMYEPSAHPAVQVAHDDALATEAYVSPDKQAPHTTFADALQETAVYVPLAQTLQLVDEVTPARQYELAAQANLVDGLGQ